MIIKEKTLTLGVGPTQGLGENSLTAEKMYSINFTVTKKKFCLSLHYNGENSYLFVNGREIVKFKAKDSEIVASPLHLRNITKFWLADNMKNAGLNGYDYEFGVDYIDFNKSNFNETIPNIHNYFMIKYNIKCLYLLRKYFIFDPNFYQVW